MNVYVIDAINFISINTKGPCYIYLGLYINRLIYNKILYNRIVYNKNVVNRIWLIRS